MTKLPQNFIEKIKLLLSKVINTNKYFINLTGIDINTYSVDLEKNKNINFGDFATKFLLQHNLTEKQIDKYSKIYIKKLNKKTKYFSKVEFIKPGFINLTLNTDFLNSSLKDTIVKKNDFGKRKKNNLFFNLEFVSANPTGLMHLGHARNAAYGDTLVNIWKTCGIAVNKEYYINDAGNQIDNLGQAVFIRYQQEFGKSVELPEDSYHGAEIIDVAKKIKEEYGDKYLNKKEMDKETKTFFNDFSLKYMLNIIKQDLKTFGVEMDIWSSERDVYKFIPNILERLKTYIYKQDDATFLRTTDFKDDKDRVLIKSDGSYTYFTPDIAYTDIKMSRGYNKIFMILGSDHNSYVARLKIAAEMLGYNPDKFHIFLQQIIKLTKNGAEFKMSKRSGNSLTIQDMLETIGKDASRWFLVSTTLDTHLNIDVDKVTSKNNDNPVYYVQYAHARISQLLEKNKVTCIIVKKYDLLIKPEERELIMQIALYPHVIRNVSVNYEVHKLCNYLYQLARLYHNYYSNHKVNDASNQQLSNQRYTLSFCVKQVINNGLRILGIEPCEKM